jgi:hypothetical protein
MKLILPTIRLGIVLFAMTWVTGCADKTALPPAPVAVTDELPASAVSAPSAAPMAAAAQNGDDAAGAGTLRVLAPAAGTITFQGFGPAAFGADAEQVRMAWGGDLGDASPDQPGGCYYLTPQPAGGASDGTAFMIEGDRFVRIDVRREDVTAPGGGKVGMTRAQLAALYPGLKATPHKYADGHYLRITDPAGGKTALVFEVEEPGDDAKATTWRIGLPPQVDYVEGCS